MTSRGAAAIVVVSHPVVSQRARRGSARRNSTASRASRVSVDRIAALTSLSLETLERLERLDGDTALDAKHIVARLVLLRALVPEGDVSHMIAVEPRLLSQRVSDEGFAHRARDALEALELRVRWDNVRKFLIEREPGLLLGDGGSQRLDEIRDFAMEHEANLCAIAGDGTSWLDVGGQRFVENFLVRYD